MIFCSFKYAIIMSVNEERWNWLDQKEFTLSSLCKQNITKLVDYIDTTINQHIKPRLQNNKTLKIIWNKKQITKYK
jgi:hypothetical protein